MPDSGVDDVPRVKPVMDDPDTSGFWRAAQEDRLVVQACPKCGTDFHMPRPFCRVCSNWDLTWREVSGFGRLYSWIVVELQSHPAFPAPYTVLLVELEDAPAAKLMGYLPGRPTLTAGQRMRVWFDHIDGETTVPQWKPV
jgi:uncharacterized OB-fold protein